MVADCRITLLKCFIGNGSVSSGCDGGVCGGGYCDGDYSYAGGGDSCDMV